MAYKKSNVKAVAEQLVQLKAMGASAAEMNQIFSSIVEEDGLPFLMLVLEELQKPTPPTKQRVDPKRFAQEIASIGIRPGAKKYVPRSIHAIAVEIEQNWKNVNYAARPYLDAMHSLKTLDDMYGADSAREVVIYFLSNATSWRGDVARNIKAELNGMLKLPRRR
jgi:hypothetical protein